MKIGILVNEFPTISETFISNKVRHLIAARHSIVIFCEKQNEELFPKLFPYSSGITLVTFGKDSLQNFLITHPFSIIKNSGSAIKGNKRPLFNSFLQHLFNQNPVDVLHVEFSGLGISLFDAIQKLNCKKVVSCRGTAEKVKLLVHDDRKQKIKKLFDVVDAIHCVSEDMRKTILPCCNDVSKIFINFPAINTDDFKRTEPYTVQSEPAIILSIGRLTFQKGYFTGLMAAKKLAGDGRNFKWIIAGDGPQKEELLFHIQQMQLSTKVELVGTKSKDEVIKLYNQANIFFLPSVYEGIANAALEAMSMELPVVATRSGGMEEVITHNIDGLLADVYDADMLASHLCRVMHNEELSKRLGISARASVQSRFNLENQTKKFIEIYCELLKR